MEQIYANPLGAFMQGQQAASVQQEQRTQNALRELYRTQGEGIASGDPAAINALAQLDPEAAMQVRQQGMQNQRLDRAEVRAERSMQLDEERLGLARQAAKAEADRLIAEGRAEEVAREAEQIKGILSTLGTALGRGDMATFEQVKATLGEDYVNMTPETYPMYAAAAGAALTGMYEAQDAVTKAGTPADDYGRYVQEEETAGRTPLTRLEFTQASKGKGVSMTMPDGTVVSVGGAQVPSLTVEAGKNTGFYLRTQDANEIINSLEEQGTKFWQQAADKAPLGVGNYARTPEFQKFDQARRDFVNAVLRRESGAVISEEEFDNANKQYFPVPGDSPEVIAQKRKNRKNAIEGLKIGSGDGAAYVDQTRQPTADGPTQDFSKMTASDLAGVNIDDLSDADVAAMLARFKELGQ